jgi:phosphoserine aminotransferase
MCGKSVQKLTDDETFMKDRVFNFSAGPAVLPEPVLIEAQRDMLSLPGVGASILEISHRSRTFEGIIAQAESNLRQLLGIPDDYAVLFLQGGARLQFSMIPMNLMGGGRRLCNYLVTGAWSKYAAQEAVKFGDTKVIWDGKATNYDRLPASSD